MGNVTGGMHKGFDYDGLTQMSVQMDTQRAFDLYGGTFNASALQIHGRNLSADNLGTLQTASGIEADRATRLWELWYQQKFLDEDRLDVKVGQQSLDQEFMTSQNANLFINTMFGWPMVPSADLPGGGPAYPLSTLGLRARARPDDSMTFLAGIFNGSPTSNNNGDSQQKDATGTDFHFNGGALAIAEMQFVYPPLGAMVPADGDEPLPRVYKLGFWYDTEDFADQQKDEKGLSLANPLSNGNPRLHHGDYSLYAVADQMVWHSEEETNRGLNVFTRVMGTPQSDRNLVDCSLNAGLTLRDPITGRDNDAVGLAMGYAHVSSRVAQFEKQSNFFTNTNSPVQTGETFIEATYQYQVMPWWSVQPDFQYVFHPGAGAVDPNTNQTIRNEAVLGVRTTLTF